VLRRGARLKIGAFNSSESELRSLHLIIALRTTQNQKIAVWYTLKLLEWKSQRDKMKARKESGDSVTSVFAGVENLICRRLRWGSVMKKLLD
jgi:hypothetical protein